MWKLEFKNVNFEWLFKDEILEIDKWINNNNNSNEMMVK